MIRSIKFHRGLCIRGVEEGISKQELKIVGEEGGTRGLQSVRRERGREGEREGKKIFIRLRMLILLSLCSLLSINTPRSGEPRRSEWKTRISHSVFCLEYKRDSLTEEFSINVSRPGDVSE